MGPSSLPRAVRLWITELPEHHAQGGADQRMLLNTIY
jgi:hypothetical protein